MSNPLFEHVPRLASVVPWMPLGQFPSPIETVTVRAPGGGEREILVKREDLCADVYAGNKIRKLEYLLAEARRRNATRLITVGAAGSHHALATTVHGRAHGFNVTLVLFPQPLTPHVRDVLRMDHALGADIRWTSRMEMVPVAMLRARLRAQPERTFIIPPGGSDALGTLGWTGAGLELAAQMREEGWKPAIIHVAAGTLGTAAGLALGLAMADMDVRIAATRITSRLVTSERLLVNLVQGAAAILAKAGYGAPADRALRMVSIRHDQIGRGYGRETPQGRFAQESFAEAGLLLDATYTAKAAAGLLADPADPSLFIHTLSAREPVDCIARTDRPLPEAVAAYLAQSGNG